MSGQICSCAPGYTLSNGFCSVCPPGQYKEDFGNGACLSCDQTALQGSRSTWHTIFDAINKTKAARNPPISRHNCTCEAGYYKSPILSSNLSGECIRCPDDVECNSRGVTLETLPLNDGTWRSSPNSINIETCYTESACLQPDPDDNVVETSEISFTDTNYQCAEGHEGPICNVCSENYVKSVSGECVVCQPASSRGAAAITFLLILLPFVVFLLVKRRRRKKMEGDENENGSTRRGDSSTIRERLSEMRNSKDGDYKKYRTKLKILTGFYQVTTQMETTLGVRFPAKFEKFSRLCSSIANLSFLQIARIDCVVDINFYSVLMTMTLAPIGAAMFISLVGFVIWKLSTPPKRKEVFDDTISILLTLSYLVFASVSTTGEIEQ